ncbi:alpha/beta fold hydrolase [Gloeobacter morelensis]|uniref:Alpha/beta fold hydrolase n=1 Tax=Gloeobacter morelensis MG652769 TaxID=2781736 RepID=A0ABY3PGM7_9CYAN|nr:alpha/beta fold hydrolase [Gloeobacter morelensis]UFP92688.1 alpha/beta fold hydrolase [Gloeobacter morelensis MG652769]
MQRLAPVPAPFAPDAADIDHPQARWLLERIERVPVLCGDGSRPVATSFVRAGRADGPPVLLLHGFDSSLLEFFRLVPLLAAHRPTWAIDLLGFGFTERRPDLACSAAALKAHLWSFWLERIGEPVVLVGASMGGAAAIDFALTHAEAVAGLVLIDSVGFTCGPAVYRWLSPPFDGLALELWRAFKNRPAWGREDDLQRAARRCCALHTAQPHWQEALLRFSHSGGYDFLAPRIGGVAHRTLILWGEADGVLGTADAERFRRAIARSSLRWLSGCGHTPHLEQPEPTARHILDFARDVHRR